MIEQQTRDDGPKSASEDAAASVKASAHRTPYHAVLVSTYDLGRQPFGLASPAAWLSRLGISVKCVDLAREPFRNSDFEGADFVAIYVPMHTATRLAEAVIPKIRRVNASAELCAYGLYAPPNSEYLRSLGARFVIGGEFEEPLAELVQQLRRNSGELDGRCAQPDFIVSTQRQQFIVPDRHSLPELKHYSQLARPDGTHGVVGYTEASRGCKHFCRHCPIVPVYRGKFRIIQKEIVLPDIRQQVEAGAQHITFGDPDFFNAVGHTIPLVRDLHGEFPGLTYDVTIKVEHLLKHAKHIPRLKDTGCAFVTSAVESVDDRLLELLGKGHTRADFVAVLELMREADLPLAPTFVSFTPWTSLEAYRELLHTIADLNMVSSVAPVQFAVRLLMPKGSLLLERLDIKRWIIGFDDKALCYKWQHPDVRMDELHVCVDRVVRDAAKRKLPREEAFQAIAKMVAEVIGSRPTILQNSAAPPSCTVPYLTEPWFC